MPHSLSNMFLRLAVVAALIGMIWGNVMGATHNYTTSTAHAHLNMLGWVSMALYGLYYRVLPHAAVGRLPQLHLWVSALSLFIMVPCLTIVRLAYQPALPLAEPLLALSGITMLVSMLVFVVVVFRSTAGKNQPATT